MTCSILLAVIEIAKLIITSASSSIFYLLMLQGKYQQEYSMSRLGVLLLDYMDYWLPLCLFITFPLWIFPAIVYYTAWRFMQVWKFWLRLGSKLVQGESSP
jgi:hypothetical protein